MRTLSDECLKAQNNPVVGRHIAELYLYKQWPGKITSYGNDNFTVEGDCRYFLSSGDYIILSCLSLNSEYEVDTVTWNSGSYTTTISLLSGPGQLSYNLSGKDYFYKKSIVTEYLIRDGIGDIRKAFEDKVFGTIRPHQVNLQLFDDGDEYVLTGTKLSPGLMFKDMYVSEVESVTLDGSLTKITLSELTTDIYAKELFLQYHIAILDGKARNNKYKIVQVSTIGKHLWVNDIDLADDLLAGDTIHINMQQRFMSKLKFGIKCYPSDRHSVFFGVLYPKNITKGFKRLDLICYSFVKDWESEYAFQVSKSGINKLMPNTPGIIINDYDLGGKRVSDERVVDVIYKYPAGNLQGITGIKISAISEETGIGSRLLRYRKPYYFQWDGGTWVTLNSEATGQTLTASDSSTIEVDCRPNDYSSVDTEELIFIDVKSKVDISILSRGPAGIKVDDGSEVQLFSKFMRIWVDETYSSGTIADEGDMKDVSNDDPIEILPNIASNFSIYFGMTEKFGGIKIKGLRPLNTVLAGLTFEYSLAFGADPNCFNTLTVTDGASGLSQDGKIVWDIPDDWGKKAKVGDSSDYHMYWIRIRGTGDSLARLCDSIEPIIVAIGGDGDYFKFESDWRLLSNEDDIKDNIIIKLDTDGETLIPAVWKQCVRVIDIFDELIEKSGYGIDTSLSNGLISLPKKALNIWGKVVGSENRLPTQMCKGNGNCDGFIFVTFKNAIYRLKGTDYEWELLFECDYNYTLYTIHYYDSISEYSGTRNFVLASGFKDVIPNGSVDGYDYLQQPEQIFVRIDDVDGDNYFGSISTIAAGQKLDDHTETTDGYGHHDTKYLFRSGATQLETLFSSYWHGFIGTVFNAVNGVDLRSEALVIPFPQLAIRHAMWYANHVTLGGLEIDADVISILTSSTDWALDLPSPSIIDPGYYLWYLDVPNTEDQIRDMCVRSSLGQQGGMIGVYFPGYSYGTSKEYGIWGQANNRYSWDSWQSLFRFMCLPYGKSVDQGTILYSDYDMGVGMWAPGAGSVTYRNRSQLLCGFQLPPDTVGEADDQVIQAIYLDVYQESGVYIYNEKYIEIMTPRRSDDVRIITDNMVIYHWDNSAGTWNNIGTTMPINVQLDQNDILMIGDDNKFSDLYLDVTVNATAIAFDYEVTDGASGWRSAGVSFDNFSGLGVGAHSDVISYPMHKLWKKDTVNPPVSGSRYYFRMTQTGAGNVTINRIAPTRRILWTNYDSAYTPASRLYDFVPLEMCYDSDNDNIYGCFLDQMTLEYHLFCYLDLPSRKTDSDNSASTYCKTVQLDDPHMQPVGFAWNSDDGYLYFVATDRRYRRKTAELWRAKYSGGSWTTEKLNEIMAGEWDCPTKLVVIDGNVYGFTGPNNGYFWEYSSQFYLRLPIADLGKTTTVKNSINDTGQILNLIATVDEDAKTITRKRLDERFILDKIWTKDHIKNIEFARESKSTLDGITIDWNHGDFKGVIKIGETGLGYEVLPINNKLIMFPVVAMLLGEELWKYYIRRRREIEGTCIFLYQHQLFDAIANNLTGIKRTSEIDITLNNNFQIKSCTLSWKRKNLKFILTENKNNDTVIS